MADHEFLFSMRLPGTGRHEAMVTELTSNVLRHLGFAAPAVADLSGELAGALPAAAPGSPEIAIRFEARSGEIEIVASQNGRRLVRLSRRVP